MSLKVAIVSRDAAVRAAAAEAFTGAPPEWSVQLCEEAPAVADVVLHGPDAAVEGATVFDPANPDDALRAVEAAATSGRVYAVAAAAGGAGATSIALHLAAALGGRTCYAELCDASARLGLPEDARTWLPRDRDCEPSALPVAGGFRVLRSPGPCPEPAAFPLDAAGRSFDHVVLDAGTRRDLGCVVSRAAVAVVVTPPTRPAALAARSLVETFPEARWAVVVNRLGPGGQIMRAGLESLLGRRVTVELPCCPALRDAEDQSRLLNGSWRRWTRGVTRLAAALQAC
ncbi:MAG TPA: hypothetical protein VHJ76_01660 [Actinomycetota bacterium]|nr:hypothetical protein [Actinomycetota bacterium]